MSIIALNKGNVNWCRLCGAGTFSMASIAIHRGIVNPLHPHGLLLFLELLFCQFQPASQPGVGCHVFKGKAQDVQGVLRRSGVVESVVFQLAEEHFLDESLPCGVGVNRVLEFPALPVKCLLDERKILFQEEAADRDVGNLVQIQDGMKAPIFMILRNCFRL